MGWQPDFQRASTFDSHVLRVSHEMSTPNSCMGPMVHLNTIRASKSIFDYFFGVFIVVYSSVRYTHA
jgi:hypothetical protein